MQDFLIAGFLCLLSLGAVIVGAIYTFRQKAYFDRATQTIITEIEIPKLGKLKTNTPAIALVALGLIFGYFAYDLMKGRGPHLVDFAGEVTIDQDSSPKIDIVMVGITSGAWIQPTTPNGARGVPVRISVPNSWPSYSAFAFAIGAAKTRPTIIGANLDNPTFKLSIKP